MSTMEKLEDTARLVKNAREKLSLTQEELGEKIGRDRRSIGRYERAEEELPPGIKLAILYLLNENNNDKKTNNWSRRKGSQHAKAVHARRRN